MEFLTRVFGCSSRMTLTGRLFMSDEVHFKLTGYIKNDKKILLVPQ
jgi:hypothetical protein